MNRQIKIVLTGAESTGKSTLAEALANHFHSIWIPEFARDYIEKLQEKYSYNDVEEIARKQIEIEKQIDTKSPMVFFDTWLIITKVWFDFVYGKHPDWLHRAILNSNIDLFLLCDTDMPWEADAVRENGGENRLKLQEIYINELQNYKFEYRMVKGANGQRIQNAINLIKDFQATL